MNVKQKISSAFVWIKNSKLVVAATIVSAIAITMFSYAVTRFSQGLTTLRMYTNKSTGRIKMTVKQKISSVFVWIKSNKSVVAATVVSAIVITMLSVVFGSVCSISEQNKKINTRISEIVNTNCEILNQTDEISNTILEQTSLVKSSVEQYKTDNEKKYAEFNKLSADFCNYKNESSDQIRDLKLISESVVTELTKVSDPANGKVYSLYALKVNTTHGIYDEQNGLVVINEVPVASNTPPGLEPLPPEVIAKINYIYDRQNGWRSYLPWNWFR